MNNGTFIDAPVSTVAGFVAFVAVFPLTPGSVWVISKTTLAGMSADNGIPSSEFIEIETISPSFNNCGESKIDFSIENKNVVLVDDVLFTGRSIKAAMSSIDTYGRPKSIELLVLIDRRFKREIPIQANYCGAKIDTFKGDRVKVVWGDKLKDNVIYIES